MTIGPARRRGAHEGGRGVERAEARGLGVERRRGIAWSGSRCAELGRDLRDVGRARTEILRHLVGRPVRTELADDLGPGPVGGRPAGLPGAAPEHRVALVGGLVGHRLGQPGLADAGIAGDKEQRALAAPCPGEGREQFLALGAPPHERRAAAHVHIRRRERRGGPWRRGERWILHEDCSLEVAELAGGLDAELLGERVAGLMIGVERVGLAAGAVEREHEMGVQTLAHRLGRDELLQLGDQLAVPAGLQVGLDANLHRCQPLLFEACDLCGGERGPRQLGERRPTPQREALAKQPGRRIRVARRQLAASAFDQPLEPLGIQLALAHANAVAGGSGREQLRVAQRLSQPRDVNLDRLHRAVRRVLPPQPGSQPLRAHGLVGTKQQHGEQRSRFPAAERNRTGFPTDHERSEDPELDSHPRATLLAPSGPRQGVGNRRRAIGHGRRRPGVPAAQPREHSREPGADCSCPLEDHEGLGFGVP